MFSFWKKKPLLTPAQQEQVVACIRDAESKTTGELRIYMESRCSYVNPVDRAVELFHQLGMIETEKRNAVLVYLATEDKQFALAGDEEIYKRAGGAEFWEHAAAQLKSYLQQGLVTEGLCICINELGKAMAQHFPFDPTVTRNELPDEIVFGK